MHFLVDGSVKLMILYEKRTYYPPLFLIMKCLVDYDDSLIFRYIFNGLEDDGRLKWYACFKIFLKFSYIFKIISVFFKFSLI